jgi:hypothetical protein
MLAPIPNARADLMNEEIQWMVGHVNDQVDGTIVELKYL